MGVGSSKMKSGTPPLIGKLKIFTQAKFGLFKISSSVWKRNEAWTVAV